MDFKVVIYSRYRAASLLRSKDVVRYPPQGRGAMMRKAVEVWAAKLWR